MESYEEIWGRMKAAYTAKLLVTGVLRGVTETEARRLLDRLLPAHLAWELTLLEE